MHLPKCIDTNMYVCMYVCMYVFMDLCCSVFYVFLFFVCILLFSFFGTGSTFLAFSIIAERKKIISKEFNKKGFY